MHILITYLTNFDCTLLFFTLIQNLEVIRFVKKGKLIAKIVAIADMMSVLLTDKFLRYNILDTYLVRLVSNETT